MTRRARVSLCGSARSLGFGFVLLHPTSDDDVATCWFDFLTAQREMWAQLINRGARYTLPRLGLVAVDSIDSIEAAL